MLYFTAMIGSFPSPWDLLLTCFSDPYLPVTPERIPSELGKYEPWTQKEICTKAESGRKHGFNKLHHVKFPCQRRWPQRNSHMHAGGGLAPHPKTEFLLKRKTLDQWHIFPKHTLCIHRERAYSSLCSLLKLRCISYGQTSPGIPNAVHRACVSSLYFLEEWEETQLSTHRGIWTVCYQRMSYIWNLGRLV